MTNVNKNMVTFFKLCEEILYWLPMNQ